MSESDIDEFFRHRKSGFDNSVIIVHEIFLAKFQSSLYERGRNGSGELRVELYHTKFFDKH